MSKQEITKSLKDKGFTIEEYEDGIGAILNRNLDIIEIKMAIPELEDHQLVRLSSNQIGIICMDE